MIHDKREFAIGAGLMVVFLVALGVVFSPVFGNGRNALDYLDGVFNSISKASAYYVPASVERARKLEGTAVSVRISAQGRWQAARMEKLFRAAGVSATAEGEKLSVAGDLGGILRAALADADLMFGNDGAAVAAKYGFEPRSALFAWHTALTETMKELNRQQRFKEAVAVRDTITRSIEPAYNYYGVTAVSMRHMVGIAIAALVGYVLYTVWYGYAILFLFEGWGLKLEH